MAYIDKEKMLKYLEENNTDDEWIIGQYNADWIYGFIESQPTADVVEVVRCKDCRFNVANMEKDGYDTTDYDGIDIVCSYFMTDGMRPDDFCSYGERRDT
jgi:hypothetical protein